MRQCQRSVTAEAIPANALVPRPLVQPAVALWLWAQPFRPGAGGSTDHSWHGCRRSPSVSNCSALPRDGTVRPDHLNQYCASIAPAAGPQDGRRGTSVRIGIEPGRKPTITQSGKAGLALARRIRTQRSVPDHLACISICNLSAIPRNCKLPVQRAGETMGSSEVHRIKCLIPANESLDP